MVDIPPLYFQRRHLLPAARTDQRTTRMERTTRWRMGRTGHFTRRHDTLFLAARRGPRYGGKQRLRVRISERK